jgi:poly(A) polymerase Pap1
MACHLLNRLVRKGKQRSRTTPAAVQDNNLLRGMDDASVRSINGCRVTDKILLLVQQRTVGDCTAFREALRFLKARIVSEASSNLFC